MAKKTYFLKCGHGLNLWTKIRGQNLYRVKGHLFLQSYTEFNQDAR